jgi:hypothetical protein
MKKILLYISFLFFGLNAIHADVKYTIDEEGVLIIEGTGDMTMPNYSDDNRPGWSNEFFWEVIIKDGVKNIGDEAFAGLTTVFSIRIPNSVESIGKMAFCNCTSLGSVFLPESVKLVGSNAFKGCEDLTDFAAYANEDLQLGSGIFEDCTSLSAISFFGKNLPSGLSDSEDWNLGLDDETINACKLVIPEEFYDKYKSIDPWNQFADDNVSISINLNDDEEYVNTEGTHMDFACYVRDFKDTKWQALFLPFALTVEEWKDDLDFAYINDMRQIDTDDDGDIDETWMDIVPIKHGCTYSGWPYLVRARSKGKRFFRVLNDFVLCSDEIGASEGPICSTTSTIFTFLGNYEIMSGEEMAGNKYYGIFNGKLTLGDSESPLKPCRWYMISNVYDYTYFDQDDDYSANTIKINVIGGDKYGVATGIKDFRMTEKADNSVYDLNGRKMNEKSLKPGLYIKNGKKLVIK